MGRAVSVTLSARQAAQAPRQAVLLSAAGERLKTFSLVREENELPLYDFEPGIYSIRVEAGDEVAVQQIRLS